MTKVFVEDNELTDIAEAIREKNGTEETYKPSEMGSAIRAIVGGSNGSSGGNANGLAYDMGEFVLDTDIAFKDTVDGIPHKLGETPDFVLIWTDDFANLSAENVSPYENSSSIGYMWMRGLFGMTQRLSSVNSSEYGQTIGFSLNKDDYRLNIYTPSSPYYVMQDQFIPTNEKIGIIQLGSVQQQWRAGVTYKYFVSKAWWNIGGVANA